MRRDLRAEVRALLLANPEGLTIRQIVVGTQSSDNNVRSSLTCMPDVYIDRWEFPRQGPISAVYVAVPIPEDCPRPNRLKRTLEERRKIEHQQVKALRAERAKAKHEAQGKTQIRGPWPT